MIAAAALAFALLLATPADTAASPAVAGARERTYALILNGDEHEHHVGNVESAVEALLDLGVAGRDVFVASAGGSPDARLPKPNFGPATRQTLNLQLSLLSVRVRPKDRVVVYLTGHGLPSETDEPADTRIALHRALVVRASWLLEQIETRLKSPRLIVITDCCYGGGFVLTLHEGTEAEFAGVSPTDEEHVTYCQPFAPDFWAALEGLSREQIQAAAKAALSGCPAYRKESDCEHAPYGCPSYATEQTLRFREGE